MEDRAMIFVDRNRCDYCGNCVSACAVGAIELVETQLIISDACTGCGLCLGACEAGALKKVPFEPLFERRVKAESLTLEVLRRLSRNKGAMLGAAVVLLLIVCAVFAPWVAPYDPIKIYPKEALQPPSLKHLAGTDPFGRDILSRIISGTRISLQVGLISVGIAGFFGGLLGLYAGYYGGRLDQVVTLLVNIMLAFPGILLALAVMAMLGPSLFNVMIAVGISSIPAYIRLVRGSVLSVKENVYIESARVVGCSDLRIIVRHILPNVIAPVIVLSTLGVGSAILVGASVSYLGMGAQPPTPEWGLMINQVRSYLRIAWWMATFPGLAIMITVLALNLLGDGLRDALDPRLKI
jgi:peptide/nickel transport system permease protein